MIKIGDKVKFLNDEGGGIVASLVDRKTALITTKDGFDIPYLINELLIIETKKETTPDVMSFSIKSEKEEEPEVENIVESNEPIEDDEICLALTLKARSSEITAHLINSSSYHIYYTISNLKEGEDLIFSHGLLEPDTKIRLGKLIPDNLNELIKLNAGILFFGTSFYTGIKPKQVHLKIDSNEIFNGKMLTENDYFEEDAAILPLYSFTKEPEQSFENKIVTGDLKEILEQRMNTPDPKPSKQKIDIPDNKPEEVDLHIESITDNFSGLSNGEIVEIQLARFKTALDTAIIHKSRKIVFIHGVGNGKLKLEIRRSLDRDYPLLKYQDASFQEYGYGATMVILPRPKIHS
jgi:Domain of unknown function (DUF2027)/Smr domain